MKINGQMKDFEDPLFSSFMRTEKKRRQVPVTPHVSAPERAGASGFPVKRVAIVLAALAAVVALTFYLVQSHAAVQDLNSNLKTSQGQLAQVSSQLQQSQERIATLQESLAESQAESANQKKQMGAQYRSLYRDLKASQEEHIREISAVNEQKADRSDVDTLKNETGEIKKQVGEANSGISELREVTTRNSGEIESHKSAIASVREAAGANAKEIAGVKQSLAREIYRFELGKGTGTMTVLDVALRLKDVNLSKQRFNLEIDAKGQRIRKSEQALNEPIYFYVAGKSKPYEVVITKIDKKYAVGYLSVPKG